MEQSLIENIFALASIIFILSILLTALIFFLKSDYAKNEVKISRKMRTIEVLEEKLEKKETEIKYLKSVIKQYETDRETKAKPQERN